MGMSMLNLNEISWRMSAGTVAFRWKTAAVSLVSQDKVYDNGAPEVHSRLAAVSAELAAIFKFQQRVSNKFNPGRNGLSNLRWDLGNRISSVNFFLCSIFSQCSGYPISKFDQLGPVKL